MNKSIKYRAYAYWCAKQGLNALSFAAWLNVNKKGVLYV